MSYFIYKDPTPYVFIHIPKTAGGSIIRALDSAYNIELIPNNQTVDTNYHSTIHHARELKDINNYNSFALVRNPYDRVCSFFHFRKHKMSMRQVGTIEEAAAMDKGIEYWFDAYTDQCWENTWFGIRTNQVEWIDDTVQIIRYENIDSLPTMPLFKDIELPKKRYNKSFNHRQGYNELITSTLRQTIDKVYEADFETFKYQW